MAAILNHLKLGCGGNKCAIELFDEFCTIPDLTKWKQPLREEFSSPGQEATWGLRVRKLEEMYVLNLYFVQLLIFVIIGF